MPHFPHFSPFWLCFIGFCAACHRAGSCAASSSDKCIILRRAEGLGHLGCVLLLAKLSCLIISRAAGVRGASRDPEYVKSSAEDSKLQWGV